MSGIEEIKIAGYRGIKSLELSGLRRINMILGNNNCGKSTVLEAILIGLVPSNALIPVQMNGYRNYFNFRKYDVALFFHNLDTDMPIIMDGLMSGGMPWNVNIKYFESERLNDESLLQDGSGLDATPTSRCGLLYNFSLGSEKYRSTIEFKKDPQSNNYKFSKNSTKKTRESFKVDYVAPNYSFDRFIATFNNIVTENETEGIIRVLQNVEPRITGLAVADGTVMANVGLKRMVPINMLGDGFKKLFAVLIAMYHVRGGMLIVDEIDNGLYYKSMRTLWSALLKAADELDVQVFASTHSKDSLLALKSVLTDELREQREDVKMFTLRKFKDDEVKAYAYDYEMFNHVLGQDIEIR
ncbi:MAG: AAA family ATPase [Porphyromonadaceae bacterium]|nr:AAA family ATPase [Porphyromonadaceae bacterium]